MKINIKRFYQSILLTVFILLELSFSKSANAQQAQSAIIMSSIGSLKNFSNNSMSINFLSNSNCINVQNGVAVLLNEKSTGIFNSDCLVDIKFNNLVATLYPNPVNSLTKLQLKNNPPLTKEFLISIWNSEGFKLSTMKASGYELFHGKSIDISSLNAGTYIIQIESDINKDALKLIKAN